MTNKELANALWRLSERTRHYPNYRVTPTDQATLEMAGSTLWGALAAGTRSAETLSVAQSEGCQSGPQGNAQTLPPSGRNPE